MKPKPYSGVSFSFMFKREKHAEELQAFADGKVL